MSRRRNGKEASCEPCRKAKIRCDHGRPQCERCRRRGIDVRCVYHPAPMTKIRAANQIQDASIDLTSTGTGGLSVPQHASLASSGTASLDDQDVAALAPASIENCPPMSRHTYNAEHPQHNVVDADNGNSHWIDMIAEALEEVLNLQAIASSIIQAFFDMSFSLNIPSPLLLPALSSLGDLVEHHQVKSADGMIGSKLHLLAENFFRSTRRPIVVTISTTPEEFLAQHVGENFRLEYLGIIYSLAARASVLLLPPKEQDFGFMKRLLRMSDICLTVAREITLVNDAMVWLAIENTLLSTNIYGDSSETVWRRMGDLSSDVLALGINRESNNTHIPFFLGECRRNTFSKAYGIDLMLSTLMHRAPRLLSRYADCRLPLDLLSSEVVAGPEERARACSKLDASGWSLEARYGPSSLRRARHLSMRVREEALEYEYKTVRPEDLEDLKSLLYRSRQAYDALPSHLRYDARLWSDLSVPVTVPEMLTIIYFDFLKANVQVCSAMEQADPQAATWSIQAADEMMALVLQMANAKDRSVFIGNELPITLLYYGVPSAVVLISSVKKLSQQGAQVAPLPPGVSRSSLIRHLSIFAGLLEYAFKCGGSNSRMCKKACKAVSNSLDELLNEPIGVSQVPITETPGSMEMGGDLGELNTEFSWEDFDLAEWIKSIEGTGVGAEWNTF